MAIIIMVINHHFLIQQVVDSSLARNNRNQTRRDGISVKLFEIADTDIPRDTNRTQVKDDLRHFLCLPLAIGI